MKLPCRMLGAGAATLVLLAACDSQPPSKPVTSDATIASVQQRITHDPLFADAEIRINPTATGVRLSGFVRSSAARLRAGELIEESMHVRTIDNRLIVRRAFDVSTRPLSNVVWL